MAQFCYFRSLLRIETVTFPLILWAGRVDMDWNFGKLGQLFQSFNAMPQKTCSVPPLVKFAWYLFLNPIGASCVWVSRCSPMLQLKVPLILWVALSGLYAANIEIKPYAIWSLKQVKTKKNRRQPRNVVTVAYESGRLQEVPTVLKSRGTPWAHCYAFIYAYAQSTTTDIDRFTITSCLRHIHNWIRDERII